MIPTASNYPESFDNDDNLLIAVDALRLVLSEDYTPGDSFITFEDNELINLFPNTGIITLTEQCSDIENRAISFYYGSKTSNTFENLELLPGFEDVFKPKRITNITQNVMSHYHNNLKDALIAVQTFVGEKDTIDLEPLGDTMEGRINFLYKLALKPRAWFSASKRVGLVPFEVVFTDQSLRLGAACNVGPVNIEFNFGDQTTSQISTISATSVVPVGQDNVLVTDLDGQTITKTYTTPGVYDVTLTVTNDYGTDTITLPKLISARIEAPKEATINFIPRATQNITSGSPLSGPYTIKPIIRSPVNELIDVEIPLGEHVNDPGYSYGGELLNLSSEPVDPIQYYTWNLADDLIHNNTNTTKLLYSVGGIYDLQLRVDTEFGAYRITSYKDCIDIVEKTNLWLWNYVNSGDVHSGSGSVRSYEYGLISETFKSAATTELILTKDDGFLEGEYNQDQLQREFNRNNGFYPMGSLGSSSKSGNALLYWASGRSDCTISSLLETVEFKKFNGFNETYSSVNIDSYNREWNWTSVNTSSKLCFLFGNDITNSTVNNSLTNQTKSVFTITGSETSTIIPTNEILSITNYLNGANELKYNAASSYTGINESSPCRSSTYPDFGHVSVYRSTSKGSAGYILRNDTNGPLFKIINFYRTEGTVGSPFQNIKKLQDIVGTPKLEGQFVTLSNGLYFFNNSGAISAYNDTTGTWYTQSASANAAGFKTLQDVNVEGFDDTTNTLLAVSDGDRRAYLSFDYSPNAFILFNEIDTTFISLGSRPSGEQWLAGIY